MATYIPGISASGTLAPGLTPAAVRAVLELLSAAEIAAAYLPIAGGTMAGNLDMDHYQISNVQAIDSDEITLNGLPVASEQYASNASNLSTGTVSDNRLSSNVPLKDAANTFTANQTIDFGSGVDLRTDSANWAVGHRISGAFQTQFGIYQLKMHSGYQLQWSNNGSNISTIDTRIVRNATGPTLETRAAGGLKVCNADGSALANLEARQGRFNGSNSVPPIVLRSSNAGWGGTISFGEGSTDYLNFTSSQNRIFLNGSGPLVLQNVAGTVGCSLDQSVDGTLSIRDRNASALASLNLANLTASGNVIAGLGAEASPSIKFSGTNTGIYQAAASVGLSANGTAALLAFSNLVRVPNNSLIGWASGSAHSTNITTNLSQVSAGLLQLGTTSANALGSLNLANLNSSGVAKFDGYPTSLLPAAASNAGSITYDTTLSKHVGCNGSTWNALW